MFYMGRGQLYAYQGEMAKAVEEWEIAYRIALADVPRGVPLMEEVLGIGYLHKSRDGQRRLSQSWRPVHLPDASGSPLCANRRVGESHSSISRNISSESPTISK